jgi:GMP synthase-like glutamine amidotransferase
LKPVVIFRHACCENAGYLGAFLKQRNIPWDEVRLDLNVAIPQDVSAYSGVVLMGGPMSVNDDLPWIQPTLNFIQSAFTLDIPVLGHCLGGQLMSKALGAAITQNPVQEIGWGKVDVVDHPLAKDGLVMIQISSVFIGIVRRLTSQMARHTYSVVRIVVIKHMSLVSTWRCNAI